MRKINFNILHKFCLMDFMRNIPEKVEMIYFKNLKEFGEFGNGLMALIIIYTLTALLESVPLQFFLLLSHQATDSHRGTSTEAPCFH